MQGMCQCSVTGTRRGRPGRELFALTSELTMPSSVQLFLVFKYINDTNLFLDLSAMHEDVWGTVCKASSILTCAPDGGDCSSPRSVSSTHIQDIG